MLWIPKLSLALVSFIVALEASSAVVVRMVQGRDVLGRLVPKVLAATGAPLVEKLDELVTTSHRGEQLHPFVGFMPVRGPFQPEGDVTPRGDVTLAYDRAAYDLTSPLFAAGPDDVVIGVSGGSVAMHFARDGGAERLVALLGETPRFQGKRVRVVALAAGGVKQPQQCMWLTYLLTLGARFDAVVNLDGFNEIALHEAENEPFEISLAYPRGWLQRVSPVEAAPIIGERLYLEGRRAALARSLLESPLARSRARQLVWLLQDERANAAVEAVTARLASFQSRRELDFVTQGPRAANASPEERLTSMVALWGQSSRQMHHLCAANGIEYYHCLQPNQYLAGSKPLSEREKREAFVADHRWGRMVPAGYPALRAEGEALLAEGVRFHDLTEIFRDERQDLYIDECCHLNLAGNHILARSIADAISSWGGAPGEDSPR